ncbi:hypothetical protein P8452_73518 [Trifolium repens]|nr:hypothetical protein P8452_73518 [Trifolium repens]
MLLYFRALREWHQHFELKDITQDMCNMIWTFSGSTKVITAVKVRDSATFFLSHISARPVSSTVMATYIIL